MALITGAAAQSLVADLAVSLAWYARLGFGKRIAFGEFYASVERGGAELHPKCAPPAVEERERRQRELHVDVLFEVDDAGALAAEAEAAGIELARPLMLEEWGGRSVYLHDPDGYVLCFFELEAESRM